MRLEDDVRMQWGADCEQRVYDELVNDGEQQDDLLDAMIEEEEEDGEDAVTVQAIRMNGTVKAPKPMVTVSAAGLDPASAHDPHLDHLTNHHHQQQQQQQQANKNAEQRAAHACAWLTSMYEPQDNVSMPRSALYDHYLEACSVSQQEPVNSATFGKLLRAVFPLLRTRRLGTRGNSKYHYYGIGIKADQLSLVPPQYSAQLRTTPPGASRHGSAAIMGTAGRKRLRIVGDDALQNSPLLARRAHHHAGKSGSSRDTLAPPYHTTNTTTNQQQQQQQQQQQGFHDLAEFGRYLEQLCAPNPAALPLHISYEHVQGFASAYHALLLEKAGMMAHQNFSQVDAAERAFWAAYYHQDAVVECLQTEEVSRIVSAADDYFHSYVTVSLFPHVCDALPSHLLQSIRHFAKTHETSMAATLPPCLPLTLVESKLQATRRFALGLRRRTSIGHLAAAVRAVLDGQPEMVRQMRADWLHLDLVSVREQLSWVFRVSDAYCSGLEQGVAELLSRQAPLQSWLEWAEGCADQCLAMSTANGLEEAGRALCLRWSFFTSLLLRDLTLKGGHSFGSFHLLRLLLDEYVMFYVERRIDDLHRHLQTASNVSVGYHQQAGDGQKEPQQQAQQQMVSDKEHPGIRQDVLLSPGKHNAAWQRATSEESLL